MFTLHLCGIFLKVKGSFVSNCLDMHSLVVILTHSLFSQEYSTTQITDETFHPDSSAMCNDFKRLAQATSASAGNQEKLCKCSVVSVQL